jgi:hypothetical protein
MVLCMYVARTCRACIIGILGVVAVLYVIYLVFAKATVIDLSTKMHSTNAGRGIIICLYWYYPLPLPALVECILVLQITTVVLLNIEYMMYNTHTTPSRPTMHALQVLVTYMHNTINIFHQDPKWVFLFVLSLCWLLNVNAILTC